MINLIWAKAIPLIVILNMQASALAPVFSGQVGDPPTDPPAGEVTEEVPPAEIVPAGEEAPPADIIPAGEEAPPADIVPAGDEAPPADIVPEGEEAPPAEIVPEGDEAPPAEIVPEGDEAPPADTIPEEDEAPPADTVPEGDEAPPADTIPEEDEAPPADTIPAGEEAPPADTVPAGEEAPPADIVPAGEEAPPADIVSEGEEAPPADTIPAGDEAPPADIIPAGEEEAPADIVPEGEEPSAELAETIEAVAEAGLALVDENNEALSMASAEAAELLTNGDPWFKANDGSGVKVGYTFTGMGCAGGVTECNVVSNPIQAALNDNRSVGKVIHIESGDYTDLEVIFDRAVKLKIHDSSVIVKSITLTSNSNNLSTPGSDIRITDNSHHKNYTFSALNIFVESGALIQDGVNLAAKDGTVNVAPGTYTENVVVKTDGVTLVGSIGNDTTPGADPDPNDKVVLQGENSGTGFTIKGKDVTISGFQIQNFNEAILIANQRFTATNNTIQNNAIGVLNLWQPGVSLHYNIFSGNEVAIKNPGGQNVDARFNYWGCANGPVVAHYVHPKTECHLEWKGWRKGFVLVCSTIPEDWEYYDWATKTKITGGLPEDCAVIFGTDYLYGPGPPLIVGITSPTTSQ
jgi:hypothetical protein